MIIRSVTFFCALVAVAVLMGSTVLHAADAPADPSFSLTSEVPAISYSFGTFRQGDPTSIYNFAVYNRAAPTGTTSPASLSSVTPFGDSSSLVLVTGTAQHIAPGDHADMQLQLNTSQPGNLEVIYTMRFTSDTVVASPVDLAVAGSATVLRNGDYDTDGDVDAADYVLWRKTLNQFVPSGSGADGNKDGIIDQPDYAVWRANFTGVSGAGSGAAIGVSGDNVVPEPVTIVSGSLGFITFFLASRRRQVRRSSLS